MRFTWKIGGEAGFGILTSGLVFAKIANRLGYYTFDYTEYPSLIRGGHNALEVIVSDEKVQALKKEINFLICLNQETYQNHKARLAAESCVVYDPDEFSIEDQLITKICVPFKKYLSELKGQVVMKNTIALAASLALIGSDLTILNEIIESQFAIKGQTVVEFNKKLAELGYNHVKQEHGQAIKQMLAKKNEEKHLLLSGNDAFSLASIIADCRIYCAYPMTPSSTVLTTLAAWQEKTGVVVRHAEDEISVINTALGASFMGVRSAVGTSGGGFALMVESVSLAGITEIPLVIFLAQRPGPATGMPTWTEQGDLLFACFSGHGEFPKIVLAPGDVYDMIELTTEAFNLAEIYQTPVIILSDMYLSESHKTLLKSYLDKLTHEYQIDRGKTIVKIPNSQFPIPNKYLRYQKTDDGISPRLLPGVKGFYYQANSYEHLEDGHTTEDSQARKDQVEKRNKKRQTYLKMHYKPAKLFGDLKKSNIVFVSWGSTKGSVIEAQRILKKKGIETAFLNFTYIYPLDKNVILPLFNKTKRYILIENNSQGQFGKLLQMETGIEIEDKLLKFDGRPFWPEEIVEYTNQRG